MFRVAVVMVTRDDARGIERALWGVRPHVDELVVLDLGSLDDTVGRARRCGARVVDATWSADRAAVRNVALDAADADWHVVLEPGEWIEGGGQGLVALRDIPPDRVGLVDVVPGGASRGLSPVASQPRILPGVTRFGGGHREDPRAAGLPTWRAGVVFASDDTDPARWRHDRTSAEAVLLQALSVQPDDPRLLQQWAEVLRAQGRLLDACEVYVAALSVTPHGSSWRHGLVVDCLDTLREAKRFREAITLMGAETPHWSDSPDFAFVVGDVFFELALAEPRNASQLAPLAEASWRRCLEIGDRHELPGTLTGRGSFLAAQNLSTLNQLLGRDDVAREWWATADRLRSDASLGRTASLPG